MSKNLKLFTDDASRQTYEQSQQYIEPYVGSVSSTQTSSYNKRNIGKYFIDYTRTEHRLSDFDINNKDVIEVEYLESTGIQYIDTGYIPNANTQLYIEFSLSAYNSNIKWATSPFGVRINYQQNQYVLFCPVNNTNSVYFCYGDLSPSYTQQINLNQKYVCNVNKNTWTLSSNNSTLITNTFATAQSANLPNLHLWLFKYNNNNTMPGGDDKLNIYKCTIKENDVLIHDFIPVRVGNTGYMYDKVSRALFGNSGTGEFVIGQDKRTIKYLESTGLAYIDTGIIPDVNTGIQISYSGVYKNNVNVDDFYIVGLRNNSGNTRWIIGKSGSSPAYYYGYGNYAHLPYARSYNVQYTISLNYLNNRKLTLHKTENSNLEYEEINLPNTLSFTPAYNIRIFGSAGIDASYSKAAGKMYFVKISQNNNIIMDLIPVRIGNTGYMYDKLSDRLFGNSGTGEFTLGPDIV